MTYLKDKVSLYWYAQIEPLLQYKKESFEKFMVLLNNIRASSIAFLLKHNIMKNAWLELKNMEVIDLENNKKTNNWNIGNKINIKEIEEQLEKDYIKKKKEEYQKKLIEKQELEKNTKKDENWNIILEQNEEYEVLELSEDNNKNKNKNKNKNNDNNDDILWKLLS